MKRKKWIWHINRPIASVQDTKKRLKPIFLVSTFALLCLFRCSDFANIVDFQTRLSAPGTYSPEKCNLEHQPSFSFGLRPEQKLRNDTPGNWYNAPMLHFNAWHSQQLFYFSIYLCGSRKKPRQLTNPKNSIRPINHHIHSVQGTKKRSTQIFLVGIWKRLASVEIFAKISQFINTAPGTYSPEKCNLDHQPSFSFGSRTEQKVRNNTPGK